MDAGALLRKVAETYADLATFAADILSISESGDDFSLNRHEQRAKAFFTAPGKVRIEQGGHRGSVIVTNGTELHHYMGGSKRYSKSVAQGRDQLPGTFHPAFPFGGTPAFLFHKIADNVAAAEILREEAIDGESVNCQVISVAYRQPHHDPVLDRNSSITFWVDSSTHLILRMAGQTTHRLPAHDETHTTKFNVAFTRLITNQPIAPQAFEYAPPANALDASDPHGRSGFISGGGGGGDVHPRTIRKNLMRAGIRPIGPAAR